MVPEEIQRLLGLRAGDREVVGGLSTGAGGGADQDEDDDRAGEAALPVLGESPGDARQER